MASKKKEKDFSGNKEQKNGSKFKLPDTLYGEYIRIGGNLTKNKRIDLLISEFEKLDDSEQMLVVAFAEALRNPELPEAAKIKYKDRVNKEQDPVSFTREHYGDFLGKGLTRAHIQKIDSSLYRGLVNWSQNHEFPSDFELPTLAERSDSRIRALADNSTNAEVALKRIRNLMTAALYRN